MSYPIVKTDNEYIALFGSVTRVMKAEKILKKEGIRFTLIPSPRAIPSPCGLAIKFSEPELNNAKKAFDKKKIKITRLYLKKGEGYEEVVEQSFDSRR